MANMTLDLWPGSFSAAPMDTPDIILKQQAALLAEKTGGLVEAEERSSDFSRYTPDKIRKAFYLLAPALGGYAYRLFTIEYSMPPYPVGIVGGSEDRARERQTEADFLAALQDIFAADSTRRVVSALIAQSASWLEAPGTVRAYPDWFPSLKVGRREPIGIGVEGYETNFQVLWGAFAGKKPPEQEYCAIPFREGTLPIERRRTRDSGRSIAGAGSAG